MQKKEAVTWRTRHWKLAIRVKKKKKQWGKSKGIIGHNEENNISIMEILEEDEKEKGWKVYLKQYWL